MRLARFAGDGGVAVPALVVGDDEPVLHPLGVDDMTAFLALLGENRPAADALAAAARSAPGVPLSSARLLAPLQPPTIRDFVAFQQHVDGIARSHREPVKGSAVAPEWFLQPAFYFTNPYAVVACGDDVAVPPGCSVLDFELEVAAVVGRAGSNLSPGQGHAAVVGYTVMNDWSARDLQATEMRVGLGPAKGKDFATTLGPWVVTADELDAHLDAEGFLALPMTVEVNGVEIGRDLLSNMGWPFGELVAHASRGTSVRVGDVLGSGTCGNGGCLGELWGRSGRQEPPPLVPGDVVTMTVGGIGRVSNRVVAGVDVAPVPRARQRPRSRP